MLENVWKILLECARVVVHSSAMPKVWSFVGCNGEYSRCWRDFPSIQWFRELSVSPKKIKFIISYPKSAYQCLKNVWKIFLECVRVVVHPPAMPKVWPFVDFTAEYSSFLGVCLQFNDLGRSAQSHLWFFFTVLDITGGRDFEMWNANTFFWKKIFLYKCHNSELRLPLPTHNKTTPKFLQIQKHFD